MSGTARNAAAAEAAAVYLALEDRVVPGDADLAHLTSSLQEARVWMARESAVPGFAAALEEARRLREQATAGAGGDDDDNDDDEDEGGSAPAVAAPDELAHLSPPPTSPPAAARLLVSHRHAHPSSLRIPNATALPTTTVSHLLPVASSRAAGPLPPALVLNLRPNPHPHHATITVSLRAHDQSFGPRGRSEARATFDLLDYDAALPLFLFATVELRGRDGRAVAAAEDERLTTVLRFEGQED